MPTIAQQLSQLQQDREDLVDNLETKGITGLTGDETFTELVPEVLNISGGGGGGGSIFPSNIRHIQVGDNLYNKKVYFNFPNTLYSAIKEYHRSLGDSSITHRAFISTEQITNPFSSNSYPTANNILFSTYNTFGYDDWGSVDFMAMNSTNRTSFPIYDHRHNYSGYYTKNYLGIDLAGFVDIGNVNKEIVYVDTNNPAYQYIWVDADEMGD